MGRLIPVLAILVLLITPFLAVSGPPSIPLAGSELMSEEIIPMTGPNLLETHVDGYFTENVGQLGPVKASFYIYGKGMTVAFDTGWVSYLLYGDGGGLSHVYRMHFDGGSPSTLEGVSEVAHRSNFFIGRDQGGWNTGVQNYRDLYYRSVWEGIDIHFHLSDGHLKYEFLVAPGSDPRDIALRYEGIQWLSLDDASGDLMIETPVRIIRDSAPTAYQEHADIREEVVVSFNLMGQNTVGFRTDEYRTHLPLVIDPSLEFATYIGGRGTDLPSDVTSDEDGNIYVLGNTNSGNFPKTVGSYDETFNGGLDIFVMKLESDGTSLIYSTFIGGGGTEHGYGIQVDGMGSVYVTGDTGSSNFPITPGAFGQSIGAYGTSAYVVKLNPSGTDLEYSTYFHAGSKLIDCRGIAVDDNGSAYIVGTSYLGGIPVTSGAFDTTPNGERDAYLVKFEPNGSALNFSTYLGGLNTDKGVSVAVDDFGNAYVVGYTESADYPTTIGAYDRSHNGANTDFDLYVTKVNASGSSLEFSTFIGGSGTDYSSDICVDNNQNVYITGITYNNNFPTTVGAIDQTLGGDKDLFVAKLNSSGSRLDYSTYIGGSGREDPGRIMVREPSIVYMAGSSDSDDFPITHGAYNTKRNGDWDSFFSIIDMQDGKLYYSTFLGGSDVELTTGVGGSLSTSGERAYIVGTTHSTDISVSSDVIGPIFNGGTEGFLFTFDIDQRPSWGPVPTIEMTEDILFSVDFAPYINDGDTPQYMLRVVSDHDYVVVSIGRTITFQVPNGIPEVTIPVVLTDGFWNVSKDIVLQVEQVNDPPIVDLPNEFHVVEDIPKTIDLWPYLDDVDGPVDELEVTTESPYGIVDGFNITVTIPNGFSNYTLWINVSDGENITSAYLNLIITQVNDPPVIESLGEFDAIEDERSVFYVGPFIDDPDTEHLDLVVTTDSSNCQVEGHYLNFDYTAGGFTEFVKVFVSDGSLSVNATIIVHVKEVNDLPIVAEIERQIVREDEDARIDISPYVSDEDNSMDELTLECNADALIDIEGMELILRYEEWVGVHTINISVFDGTGRIIASIEVQVSAVNDPPQIERLGSMTEPGLVEVYEGSRTYLELLVTDEEGGKMFWALESTWTEVKVLENGTIVIVAKQGDVGQHQFTLEVSDDDGGTDIWSINVTVVNVNDPPQTPVLRAPVNGTIWELGQNVTFTLRVDDPDLALGQLLTITFESNISGLYKTFTSDEGLSFVYDGLPAGHHRIEVIVSDGEYESSLWFTLTIEDPSGWDDDDDDDNESPSGLSGSLLVLILFIVGLAIRRRSR
jgi:hypothetical protein